MLSFGFSVASDPKKLKNGELLAKKNNCVICHSTNGVLAPDLKDFLPKYVNGKTLNRFLINPTMTGKYPGMMPPLKITEKEADDLLLYLQKVVKEESKKKLPTNVKSK